MLRTVQSLPPCRAFDAGLRPDPFPGRAASLLPGLLAATRTGLAPAGDNELMLDHELHLDLQLWTHFLREIHARSPQDLVGLAQLAHLALQALEPLALIRGQAIAARTVVGLGLAHPLTQRLPVDAEILGDMRDRAAALHDEPHRAFTQLVGILSRGRHRRSPSSPQDEILASRTPSNPAWLRPSQRRGAAPMQPA